MHYRETTHLTYRGAHTLDLATLYRHTRQRHTHYIPCTQRDTHDRDMHTTETLRTLHTPTVHTRHKRQRLHSGTQYTQTQAHTLHRCTSHRNIHYTHTCYRHTLDIGTLYTLQTLHSPTHARDTTRVTRDTQTHWYVLHTFTPRHTLTTQMHSH